MKTLKQFKEESRQFYTEKAAVYFRKSFNKKMGGTQKITFEDDFIEPIEIDKREYYSGRGAKYNNASMHEHLETFITKSDFETKVNDRAKMFFERQKDEENRKKALKNFCKTNGLDFKNFTSIYDGAIFFENKKAVESELDVNLDDFFDAPYKTYFFAETKIGLLMFYHNHHQSYSFETVTADFRKKFHDDWHSVPYDCPNFGDLYYC